MILLSVLKCAIASLVVICPSVIAIRPTVSLKLSSTVLSGTVTTLNFLTAQGVRYSELSSMNNPQFPISAIETQTILSVRTVLNHSCSFLGGVFPMDMSKYSSARQIFRLSLGESTNIRRYKASTCCCKL